MVDRRESSRRCVEKRDMLRACCCNKEKVRGQLGCANEVKERGGEGSSGILEAGSRKGYKKGTYSQCTNEAEHAEQIRYVQIPSKGMSERRCTCLQLCIWHL